ncbi:uncharacterized protein [Solanum lycopersicum]|uniref:uncharacterized protein n=1 Tax=Solanum lycopersicum TaxID=4081 RepID=UPI00374A6DDF
MSVYYNPGKANIVADALIRLSIGSVAHVEEERKELVKDVHRLARLGVLLMSISNNGVTVQNEAESSLGKFCASDVGKLRQRIIAEVLISRFVEGFSSIVAPLTALMKKKLKFEWVETCKANVVADAFSRMGMGSISDVEDKNKELVKDIHRQATLDVRAEGYARLYIDEIVRLHGISLSIISDRYAQFTSHFLRSFEKNLGMQVKLSTAIYPQTDWQEERLIQTLEDMLRACVIDFIGLFEDITCEGSDEVWQIGEVDSEKFLGDPTSILPVDGLGVDEDLSNEEVLVDILDRQNKRLTNKEIATVKLLWRNHLVEVAIWEADTDMRSRYPHLFSS